MRGGARSLQSGLLLSRSFGELQGAKHSLWALLAVRTDPREVSPCLSSSQLPAPSSGGVVWGTQGSPQVPETTESPLLTFPQSSYLAGKSRAIETASVYMGESTHVCPSPDTTQEWKSEGFERVCGIDWDLLSLTHSGCRCPPPPQDVASW